MVNSPSVAGSVLETIGNTPVVKLSKVVPENSADVYVKIESGNPTGSYKDRMALAIIEGAEASGALKPGMTVVEFTAGSTGSSLAFVCAVKGYRFNVVSSDAFAPEKLATMRAFGAEVTIVPNHGKGISSELMARMRAVIEELDEREDVYWTRQFENTDLLHGYDRIGEELMAQIPGEIDVFCGAAGTAGMVMGVSEAFHRAGIDPRVVVLEPAGSPILSRGISGSHRIEGVGPGFVPPLLNDEFYDDVMTVEDDESRAMTRRLAREEGIFCGPSSGMNVAAALRIAREIGPDHNVVTIAVDSGLKYLGGDVFVDD